MDEKEIIAKQKAISKKYDDILEKTVHPLRALVITEIKKVLCSMLHNNNITPAELDNILGEFKEINQLAREYENSLTKKPSSPFSKN
jgi:DNA repair ATPase RecN